MVPDDPVAPFVHRRRVYANAGSIDSLALVKSWIDTCIREHHLCWPKSSNNVESVLPRRVIDLAAFDGSGAVRLTNLNGRLAKYTTLSHCWGKKQHLATTLASIDKRKRGILFSSLPRSFRDAVLITRLLGIQYLWIDALCIIQDSAEDWQVESAKMGDIYKNAFLTIAAVGAENSSEGCFVERFRGPSWKFDYTSQNGVTKGFVYAEAEPVDDFDDQPHGISRGWLVTHFKKAANPAPLAKRAWAFQESLLSTRIIRFGSHYTSFTCETETVFEDSSEPLLQNLNRSLPSWTNLVMNFTRKALTKETDTLPALSGLAHEYNKRRRDEYLAGLWRKDICSTMCWSVDGGQQAARPLTYRAPSWSWASINGRILWVQSSPLVQACQVVSAHVVPSGRDPMGQVRGGTIKLSAPLRKAHCVPNLDYPDLQQFSLIPIDESENHDSRLALSEGRDTQAFAHFDVEEAPSEPLYCVQVMMRHGLLLLPTERESTKASEPGVKDYRRVGVFAAYAGSGGSDWFEGCKTQLVTIV